MEGEIKEHEGMWRGKKQVAFCTSLYFTLLHFTLLLSFLLKVGRREAFGRFCGEQQRRDLTEKNGLHNDVDLVHVHNTCMNVLYCTQGFLYSLSEEDNINADTLPNSAGNDIINIS
jgi:hypothetical protein